MNVYVREVDASLLRQLQKVSLSMFRKGFFSIFKGSISARVSARRFVINKRNAVLDSLDVDSFMVSQDTPDYRWQEASSDTPIHASIYRAFSEARFIVYARPPYSIAYSLTHTHLIPLDYLGCALLGQKIEIYDPKSYKDWQGRAPTDILHYLQESAQSYIFIKGCGIVAYHRELQGLLKIVDLLESSCQILQLAHMMDHSYEHDKRFEV
ncbi:class II aldolase and adducin N-terminal domain-containing protein [Helicobacter baculiformis]|uniref:Class II aldolase and adducin N-terminal domain-containing protein n=1 Tax=Helicobacter baculiformis TaxID=427351 RepID=A0ABV7ZGL8_9HELI|nr:class II aldolase and adducin N-terminal domain-containing protein [Helicobacter baculiformis]